MCICCTLRMSATLLNEYGMVWKMVRPTEQLLLTVVYKKSIGTKMNDLDLCLEVV